MAEEEVNQRIIPLELDEVLFFMWANGMSHDDIVAHFKDSDTPFDKKQLYRYAHKRGWVKRKESIEREIKKDFEDILKRCQSKKMSAISMAIQTVSDIIIKDVADYRENPEGFWRDVKDFKRPRPFWMAKNVSDLSELYKLQKFLELSDQQELDEGRIHEGEKAAILQALADVQKIKAAEEYKLLPEGEIVDAEVEEIIDGKNEKDRHDIDQEDQGPTLCEQD